MASKKQHETFNNQVVRELVDIGALRTIYDLPVNYREYKLQTKAGELTVTVHDPEASKVFSIFCMFNNPKEAYTVVPNTYRLNTHSGKYNFHEMSAEECLRIFKAEISQIV